MKTVTALLLLAVLSGCANGGAAAVNLLEARTFLSVMVTDGGAARQLVPGTQIRLTFKDARISVSAGCNIMGGTYGVRDGTLHVDGGAMTEMGCDDERHAQDDWLFEFLASRPSVTLNGNDLVLRSGGTTITLLDRKIAEPDLNLAGPTWQVVSIVSGAAVSSVPDGVVPTFVFGADGRVHVETGCNSGNGTYLADAKSIRFSSVGITKGGCVGAAAAMEAAVLAVLSAENVQYRIEAKTLDLIAGRRGLQLSAR